MRKTISISILFILIFILALLQLLPSKASAQERNICYSEAIVDEENDYNVTVKLDRIENLYPEDKICLHLNSKCYDNGTIVDGRATFELGKLSPGDYSYDFLLDNIYMPCSEGGYARAFQIPDVGQGGETIESNLDFAPQNPTPKDEVTIIVDGLQANSSYVIRIDKLKIILQLGSQIEVRDRDNSRPDYCESSSADGVLKSNLGSFPDGIWEVSVFGQDSGASKCQASEDKIASGKIIISAPDLNLIEPSPSPTPTRPPPPCKQFGEKGECIEIETAVGDIKLNPFEFVTAIMGILLGIAGIIAVILIIIGGYRLMASQGNPEAVQAAREQITSAIVGLLFIIFSLVILEVIGVDILRIPGFEE